MRKFKFKRKPWKTPNVYANERVCIRIQYLLLAASRDEPFGPWWGPTKKQKLWNKDVGNSSLYDCLGGTINSYVYHLWRPIIFTWNIGLIERALRECLSTGIQPVFASENPSLRKIRTFTPMDPLEFEPNTFRLWASRDESFGYWWGRIKKQKF